MPGVTFTFVDADGPCEIGEMAPRGEICPVSALVASIALPLAYLLFILIYLLEFDSASTIQRSNFRNALSRSIPPRSFRSTDEGNFKGTKFVHENPLGVETSKCCYRRGPAQG